METTQRGILTHSNIVSLMGRLVEELIMGDGAIFVSPPSVALHRVKSDSRVDRVVLTFAIANSVPALIDRVESFNGGTVSITLDAETQTVTVTKPRLVCAEDLFKSVVAAIDHSTDHIRRVMKLQTRIGGSGCATIVTRNETTEDGVMGAVRITVAGILEELIASVCEYQDWLLECVSRVKRLDGNGE